MTSAKSALEVDKAFEIYTYVPHNPASSQNSWSECSPYCQIVAATSFVITRIGRLLASEREGCDIAWFSGLYGHRR